jgi:hypothetical protein
MAFVKKSGSRFQVRQGNNDKVLSTFGSKKAADQEVARLHRKNDPKSSNRGKRAAKKHR